MHTRRAGADGTARELPQPLLFKGRDCARTDVIAAR